MGLTTTRARRARRGRPLLAAALALASTLGMPPGSARAALSPVGENYTPQGTAYDAGTGTLYSGASDGHTCRVFAVSGTGVVRLVAGSGLCGYSGDGGPATAARIEEPYSLAVDASGNVYETGGYGVRRISASTGTITDYAGKHEIACLVGGRPLATVGANASTVGVSSFAIAINPVSGHLFAPTDARDPSSR